MFHLSLISLNWVRCPHPFQVKQSLKTQLNRVITFYAIQEPEIWLLPFLSRSFWKILVEVMAMNARLLVPVLLLPKCCVKYWKSAENRVSQRLLFFSFILILFSPRVLSCCWQKDFYFFYYYFISTQCITKK